MVVISRDISFIVGRHHPHLQEAIEHHRHRNGLVFEVTTVHESIGSEVVCLWFDRSGLLERFGESPALDLGVCCGLAVTGGGPVAFILWWLPPIHENGVPHFLKEQILNPTHQGTRNIVAVVPPKILTFGAHRFADWRLKLENRIIAV